MQVLLGSPRGVGHEEVTDRLQLLRDIEVAAELRHAVTT